MCLFQINHNQLPICYRTKNNNNNKTEREKVKVIFFLKRMNMKLTELKCDVCEKTKDANNTGNENHNLNNSTVSDQSESLSASSVSNKSQVVVSKCLDCNSFMCAGCYADHQNISSFGAHQMVSLNNISLKDDNENDESLR